MPKAIRKITVSHFFVPAFIALAWCAGHYFGLLDFIESKTIDWRFAQRGELRSKTKIFYLDVDAKSIADVGNLAWDRAYYAEVCAAALQHGGASVVGIDYVFSERGMPEIADWGRFHKGSLKLAEFLFADPPPPVVLAAGYASGHDRDINGVLIRRVLPRVLELPDQPQTPELPQFSYEKRAYTPPNVGLIDTIDGGMYKVPLIAPEGAKMWYHMSIELARLAWKLPPESVHVRRDRIEFVNKNGVMLASVPLTDGQDVEVNWGTHWISPQNPRASFSEALASATLLKSTKPEERAAGEAFFAQMKDAIVLVGPVDPLLQDRATTRLDFYPVPRVGIMGNLVRMYTSGLYLKRPPMGVQWLLIIGLVSGVCVLQAWAPARYSILLKSAALGLLIAYIVGVFWVFSTWQIVLPLVSPVGAALSASFVLMAILLLAAERMRHRITSFFGSYVSPALVERMIESGNEPQLDGVEVPITAFFSDIQNFTMMAETMPPARLVELMNDYLSTSTDIITAHDGTLDKYVGDAVVAMFGAPVPCVDHAYRACVASQFVHAQILDFHTRWGSILKQALRTQIGLSTGNAIVGNFGSRTRFNYTMMGDTVNVAARLESAARIYGVHTLVSDRTRKEAEKYGDKCVFRFLDKIVVKGRQHAIEVHEIMGLRDRLPPAALECSELYSRGVEKFYARDWNRAADLFAQSARLEWYPEQSPGDVTPSTVFLERCLFYKRTPPLADWDGAFVMNSK